MRRGELLGLQWGDVDFHGGFLEIRRAIVRRKETTTKTHKIRRVDMSPQLRTVLQTLNETRRLDTSLTGQPMPHWVFLSPSGQRLDDDLLRTAFHACLETAGLRRVRFHDLRQTFASLLIQQGAKPKYVQQQLGHGSISITLDIYSHLFPGDDRHVVSGLDDPQGPIQKNRNFRAESATQPQSQPDALRSVGTEAIESVKEDDW